MLVRVYVHPGARVAGVGGSREGALVVRVRERAVAGAATRAVEVAVAQAFHVPARNVSCVRGQQARTKTLLIEDADERATERLSGLLAQA